jgi:hypothetical protein
MNNGHDGWEAVLPSLSPEQKQRVFHWLHEEEETWAEREEEWLRARSEMDHETRTTGPS